MANRFYNRFIFLALTLQLLSTTRVFGQEVDKFLKAGFEDDSSFLNFYSKYLKAVKTNDSVYLSTVNHYPLNVSYWLQKPFELKDQQSFLKSYNQIYSKKMKDLILSQTADDLNTTWKGAFVNRGEVWFVCYLINDSSKILIPSFSLPDK